MADSWDSIVRKFLQHRAFLKANGYTSPYIEKVLSNIAKVSMKKGGKFYIKGTYSEETKYKIRSTTLEVNGKLRTMVGQVVAGKKPTPITKESIKGGGVCLGPVIISGVLLAVFTILSYI